MACAPLNQSWLLDYLFDLLTFRGRAELQTVCSIWAAARARYESRALRSLVVTESDAVVNLAAFKALQTLTFTGTVPGFTKLVANSARRIDVQLVLTSFAVSSWTNTVVPTSLACGSWITALELSGYTLYFLAQRLSDLCCVERLVLNLRGCRFDLRSLFEHRSDENLMDLFDSVRHVVLRQAHHTRSLAWLELFQGLDTLELVECAATVEDIPSLTAQRIRSLKVFHQVCGSDISPFWNLIELTLEHLGPPPDLDEAFVTRARQLQKLSLTNFILPCCVWNAPELRELAVCFQRSTFGGRLPMASQLSKLCLDIHHNPKDVPFADTGAKQLDLFFACGHPTRLFAHMRALRTLVLKTPSCFALPVAPMNTLTDLTSLAVLGPCVPDGPAFLSSLRGLTKLTELTWNPSSGPTVQCLRSLLPNCVVAEPPV